jgi:choline kinase
LRRKNIGPRLLGCFSNGRFEEFLHAKALTAAELKDGTISVQIAKRMRELHQGMDLLPLEREEGSFVWCSIGRWQKYCERIVGWLDTKARESSIDGSKPPSYVLGTEWSQFSDVINKYRDWLSEQYGGTHNLKNLLVFAHNDVSHS